MAIPPVPASTATGGAAPKTPSGTSGLTSLSSNEPQVFEMSPGAAEKNRIGVHLKKEDDKGIANTVDITDRKRLFNGDPRLYDMMQEFNLIICGDKNYPGNKTGARFGIFGQVARRVPTPILWDDPALIPILGDNACVDTSGRKWFYAPFYQKCLEENSKYLEMVLPLHMHEDGHTMLEHVMRMRNFPHYISNKASHMELNPMVRSAFAKDTRFSPLFLEAEGNRKEDARFMGLSGETCAKMLLSEIAMKGNINIDTLTLVDGKVDAQTTIKAVKDETKNLGNLTITIEDKGQEDVMDILLDCGMLTINKIDNQLKPRNRAGSKNPGPSSEQPDTPFKIPNIDPNNLLSELAGNPFNSCPEKSGQSPQAVDVKKISDAMAEHGYDHVVEALKAHEFDPKQLDRVIENALTEAQSERMEIGSSYPGAHMENFMSEVVRPARRKDITWDRKVTDMVQGTGPGIVRSVDEPGYLNYIDPKDMGMEDGEELYYAGNLQTKAEEIIAVMIDTSGSVDSLRLSQFLSLIISLRETANDMSPEIHVYFADTVIRGMPVEVSDEQLAEFIEKGCGMSGRGGTDFIAPANQLMAHARENNIKYSALIYCTDMGVAPIQQELLPEDLPPLLVVCVPEDYSASDAFLQSAKKVGDVAIIEKEMNLDFLMADQNQNNRGNGIKMRR
jgi:antitoxin component of RelBE/YafQ-DinJ toxin-antitoxin module